MNIIVVGQKELGAQVFEALLAAGHTVLAVCAPGGDKLATAAENAGVRCVETPEAATLPSGADLIVCAHAHVFIGERTRAAARYGAIGYHPSLLPRHRGKDAIRWAVHMKDAVTGGTVYRMTDEVDGGPILLQDWCWIRPGDTAVDLWRRDLLPMGARLLVSAVGLVAERGPAAGDPQDESLATWEPSWHRPPMGRPRAG